MATPVFCCGFECGQLGSAGQHWANAGTHSATISTSTVRSGARSLRANPSAQMTNIRSASVLASTTVAMRCYVYFATLPTTIQGWVLMLGTVQSGGAVYKTSTQEICAAFGNTLGTTGVSVVTGQWYRIDVKIDSSANPHLIDVQVNGVACSQVSFATGLQVNTTIRILEQDVSNWTGDVFIDDILASNTVADYPLGAGKVEHFVPTSDGTHTATTTTIVKGTIAAPTGGGNVAGATDVWNWVNGVPLLGGLTDNTRLVNHQTAASTLYAEVIFGPASGISTPTVAPRAVEVITADRQASTATGLFQTKLNDNGTESAVANRGSVAGVITDRYVRKHYALAPTGGAWTVVSGAGNFNNIRARFGYSSDATPDQYWRGIMIEAEFAEVVNSIPNKIFQTIQAIRRASLR